MFSIGLIAGSFLETNLLKGLDDDDNNVHLKMAQCLDGSIASMSVCARCGPHQLQIIDVYTYSNGNIVNKSKFAEGEMDRKDK